MNKGEIISIVGPSGCGKTTLLNIIAGIIKTDPNKIIFDKNEIKFGYIFQKDTLFEWLTIEQNIELGLKIQKKLSKQNKIKIEELMKKYNIFEFRKSYPNQISGGMKQKVAFIRTLAIEPQILLMDEPFSALDYQNRLKIGNEIVNIIKEQEKTAIMVTHDISEAISCSDRIIILSKRPGRIKKILNINFDKNLSTITKKSTQKFNEYFEEIWSEIDIDEEK